jgi:hypothetical protein
MYAGKEKYWFQFSFARTLKQSYFAILSYGNSGIGCHFIIIQQIPVWRSEATSQYTHDT